MLIDEVALLVRSVLTPGNLDIIPTLKKLCSELSNDLTLTNDESRHLLKSSSESIKSTFEEKKVHVKASLRSNNLNEKDLV